MMEVQKYLKEHGIAKLQEEFAIMVTDYPDRVVLNYNQIDSPRFHPIVDECRALILRKNENWTVLARSFDRFYNFGEGVDKGRADTIYTQRVAIDPFSSSLYDGEQKYRDFDLSRAFIQEKLDGSLISVYHDGEKWCASTRKMAFAEGQTTFGQTFAELFWDIAKKRNLEASMNDMRLAGEFTLVFELTGPANRIVTPYAEADITLIGGRYIGKPVEGNPDLFRELSATELDRLAQSLNVKRPKVYKIDGIDSLFELVNGMASMEEGVVLVLEGTNGSHWRIKLKNAKYLAIAHMRNNGNISPHRILALVMQNEHHEYLKYFECDKPYFSFVECEYLETLCRIKDIWEKVKNIENQKDFALTMMPMTQYSFEKGVLFAVRKNGTVVDKELAELDAKKIAESMNLKAKFAKEFGINIEDE